MNATRTSHAWHSAVHDLPHGASSVGLHDEGERHAWMDAVAPDVARAWSAQPLEVRARLDLLEAPVSWVRAPLEAGASAGEARAGWLALRAELLGRRAPRAEVAAWRVSALAARVPGVLALALVDAALAGDLAALARARGQLLLAVLGTRDATVGEALCALVEARATCRVPAAACTARSGVNLDGVDDPAWRVGLRALARRVDGAARGALGVSLPARLSVPA